MMPPRRFTHLLTFATTQAESDRFDAIAEANPRLTKAGHLREALHEYNRKHSFETAPARANGHDMANGQMEHQ